MSFVSANLIALSVSKYKLAAATIGRIVKSALRPKAVKIPREKKKKVSKASKKYEPQDILGFEDFIKQQGKKFRR